MRPAGGSIGIDGRSAFFRLFGQSEIEHFDQAVGPHHDVFGFDVAVDDAGFVRGGERLGDLFGDVQHVAHRHLAVFDLFAQRQALDEFGGDEMLLAGMADLIDGDDVRMIERAGDFGLLLEAMHALGVPQKLFRQQLERDLAIQPCVARQVNLSHAACAKQRNHFVMRQPSANGDRHPKTSGKSLPDRNQLLKRAKSSTASAEPPEMRAHFPQCCRTEEAEKAAAIATSGKQAGN